ncbi:uncharacterized protein MYCFIDRAFT_169006 [Pseudocercospora fijiensis CIRAD86]|uniref:Uncharacterized protein n=1 Tax=Pseudocercospora fijiensis (strain CIRAD86) TaxID=383855 RepID=N1Q8B0_PSEFD|nr:uncharacterized protein MYCFIDRAFT_169006 [Pseudocercospora fijiensis CIRAD86]EME87137.1 hypothetical protein MYCFIDRAFT_169006 [Pseudocercospora fijiensis CIRAD86]
MTLCRNLAREHGLTEVPYCGRSAWQSWLLVMSTIASRGSIVTVGMYGGRENFRVHSLREPVLSRPGDLENLMRNETTDSEGDFTVLGTCIYHSPCSKVKLPSSSSWIPYASYTYLPRSDWERMKAQVQFARARDGIISARRGVGEYVEAVIVKHGLIRATRAYLWRCMISYNVSDRSSTAGYEKHVNVSCTLTLAEGWNPRKGAHVDKDLICERDDEQNSPISSELSNLRCLATCPHDFGGRTFHSPCRGFLWDEGDHTRHDTITWSQTARLNIDTNSSEKRAAASLAKCVAWPLDEQVALIQRHRLRTLQSCTGGWLVKSDARAIQVICWLADTIS